MAAPDILADIVRTGDHDRYLADLFAPAEMRPHLFALHAFNVETARIRDRVSEPMLGEIRLQWWRDALRGDTGGEPVATSLRETIAQFSLPMPAFDRLLDARVFDLYDDPMPSLNDLDGYAGDTEGAVLQLGAMILAKGEDPHTADLAGHAGVALALTAVMRSLPVTVSRRQCFLPEDLLAKHHVDREAMFAGRSTPELRSLLAGLRTVAGRHLSEARKLIGGVDPSLLPVFLPLALVSSHLMILARHDHDPLRSTVTLSPWRRQWLIWRAARKRKF